MTYQNSAQLLRKYSDMIKEMQEEDESKEEVDEAKEDKKEEVDEAKEDKKEDTEDDDKE